MNEKDYKFWKGRISFLRNEFGQYEQYLETEMGLLKKYGTNYNFGRMITLIKNMENSKIRIAELEGVIEIEDFRREQNGKE